MTVDEYKLRQKKSGLTYQQEIQLFVDCYNENEKLKAQNQKMRCCQNCKSFKLDEIICKKNHIQMAVDCCDDWRFRK